MPTFYSTRFLNGHAGTVKVFFIPIIFIDPRYKDDQGLLAHEQCHVRQAWRNVFPPIHALRYTFSKAYRLKCEVEAYKKQLEYNPTAAPHFANYLATRYDLDITPEKALELLNG